MVAEILRLLISSYFLFSGVNKIFFFDRFSGYLSSFFHLQDELAFSLGVAVIALELVFAAVTVFWRGMLLPRILVLVLAVPFIAYNLWIFFVLGLKSCNCTYSASGDSMSGPLFSITVLLISTAAVFYFTSKKKNVLAMQFRIGAMLLLLLATIGTNFYLRNQYETNDIFVLRQLIAEQEKVEHTRDEPEFELFVQHTAGRPMRSAAFLANLLDVYGDTATYVLRYESVKLVDDMMLNIQMKSEITILDSPYGDRLEHLGIQIYHKGKLIYRHDKLPEMTAAIFEEIMQSLANEIPDFQSCEKEEAAAELLNLIRKSGDTTDALEPLISVNLFMERDCADCDMDLLAMLDSYFFDPERFEINIVFFMSAPPENGRGFSVSPVELSGLEHQCLYPNKLLLIDFSEGDIAIFPVPLFLGDLDQAINSSFESRGISLF